MKREVQRSDFPVVSLADPSRFMPGAARITYYLAFSTYLMGTIPISFATSPWGRDQGIPPRLSPFSL